MAELGNQIGAGGAALSSQQRPRAEGQKEEEAESRAQVPVTGGNTQAHRVLVEATDPHAGPGWGRHSLLLLPPLPTGACRWLSAMGRANARARGQQGTAGAESPPQPAWFLLKLQKLQGSRGPTLSHPGPQAAFSWMLAR